MKISTVQKIVKSLGHSSKTTIASNPYSEDDTVEIVGTEICISVNQRGLYVSVITDLKTGKFRFHPETRSVKKLTESLELELKRASFAAHFSK